MRHLSQHRSIRSIPASQMIMVVWDAEIGQQVNMKMRLQLSFSITNNLKPMTRMLCRCLGWMGTLALSIVSPGALLVRS